MNLKSAKRPLDLCAARELVAAARTRSGLTDRAACRLAVAETREARRGASK